MHHITHEIEYDLNILGVHFVFILHSLANEPQDLQTTKDHLMFPDSRGSLHYSPLKVSSQFQTVT